MITALALAITPWAVGAGPQASQTSTSSQVTLTAQPQANNVTEHTATIEWQTSAPAGAIVEYGTNQANLDKKQAVGWGGTTHRVTLRGLEPGTTYYFRVRSRNAKGTGTGVESAVDSFQTKGAGQSAQAANPNANNPSGIAGEVSGKLALTSGPDVKNVTNDKATLTWETDENSGNIVHYGTSPDNLDQTKKENWGGSRSANGFRHTVELTNLQPGTTYYYRVESTKGSGTGTNAQSPVESFQTQGANTASSSGSFNATSAQNANDQFKTQAGPIAQNVTENSATLWWMTNGNTRTMVKYGTDQNNLSQSATGPHGREHKVQLTGLQPGTTYYFALLTNENQVREQGSFQTPSANQANSIRITNGPKIESLNSNQAVISWSTNRPASTVVRYGTDANNLTQTAQAPWGSETHTVTLKNLQPNTTYYFAVESSQAQGTGTMAKSSPAPFQTPAPGATAMIRQ
jgi:phosphodiesterase/alkaline phosphatase D-like protein